MINKIAPCLWFDGQAEEAARFYVSVFKHSKITNITYYGHEGQDVHGQVAGTVQTVEFHISRQTFTALNGGPLFRFNESISFQIFCDTQEEIDYYWERLTADGGEESYCGWVKDKFGLSWQIVPTVLAELMLNQARADRIMNAFMQMRKLNIEKLINA